MKKIFLAILFTSLGILTFAQEEKEEEPSKGFKRENMFAGGSINLGLGGGSFNVGANPQIGYSVANWLDVGVTTNIIYFSQRYNISGYEIRQRSWNYGGGPFVRICPISMIHLQAQYEYNWTSGTAEDINSGTRQKFNVSAPSLLVGAGYGRRLVGESWFFTTVLFDVTKDVNSPYVYVEGQSKISLPIIRAGFNVYFNRKKDR
jgi:hypothetical protein